MTDKAKNAELAEIHHQVRNSFQNLAAYMKLLSRPSGELNVDRTQRVLRHIRMLSQLHDSLINHYEGVPARDTARDTAQSTADVNQYVSELFADVPDRVTIQHGCSYMPLATARQAMAIGIILNELVQDRLLDRDVSLSITLKDGNPAQAENTSSAIPFSIEVITMSPITSNLNASDYLPQDQEIPRFGSLVAGVTEGISVSEHETEEGRSVVITVEPITSSDRR